MKSGLVSQLPPTKSLMEVVTVTIVMIVDLVAAVTTVIVRKSSC